MKPRALKGIFLGYPQGTKGYKVWLLEELKVVISRNVVFQEEVVYKDLQKQETKSVEEKPAVVDTTVLELNKKTENVREKSVEGGAIEVVSSDSESETEEGPVETIESSPQSYRLARDRVRRIIKAPVKFSDYSQFAFALMMAEEVNTIEEPSCFHEALESNQWESWNSGMKDEMESLLKNETWEIVDRPDKQKVISSRWLYKKKPGIPGVEPERFKARLVARGFTQRKGIDYDEVFAPVVKHISIRILMSVVVKDDLELEQMDVKTAFLHGEIDQPLYMDQPEGYVHDENKDQVCLLKRALYGLKQAPRQWNRKFNAFMIDHGFVRSGHDSCVYVKEVSSGEYVYLLIYVHDMLIAAKSVAEINKIKKDLSEGFEMKDMGAASRILGIDISRNRSKGTLELSQSGYLNRVLDRFHMSEAKGVSTPMGAHFKLASVTSEEECVDTEKVPYASAIGSIMYAMVGTRPDVAQAIGVLSRFMGNPGKVHWTPVKWLLRYLKNSSDLKLVYTQGKDLQVQGYSDSDYAADLDRRRSTTGYVFTVGGNTVSWKSNLQSIVALSTTEAEYVALTEAVKEALWIKGLLSDMGIEQQKALVWSDSQSAISLSKNNSFHERTKHIAIKYYFIRDVIEEGEVEVLKIHTSRNPADMLTKGIPVQKFEAALEFLKLLR